MTRFWEKSQSDASSSSDDESRQDFFQPRSDANDEDGQGNTGSEKDGSPEDAAQRKFMKQRYRDNQNDDRDKERASRVIKSAREKRWHDIEATSKHIENAVQVDDWVIILNVLTLCIEFEKLKRLLGNDSSKQGRKAFLSTIIALQELHTKAHEHKNLSKMSATNARALNIFRQRIHKAHHEYGEEIKQFRQDPRIFDSESEHELVVNGGTEPTFDKGRPTPERAAWDDTGFGQVGLGGRIMNITPGGILESLRLISLSHGKMSTNRAEQIRVLEELKKVAVTPYQKILVLLALVDARFEYRLLMPPEQWTAARDDLVSLLDILEENKQFIILEDADDISYNDFAPELQPGEVIKIHGSIASFIARLDDELNNALRKIDPHTPEYIDRLRDELKLYAVIVKGQIWSERIEQEGFDTGGSLTRLILGRLEHIYYKPASLIENLERSAWKHIPATLDSVISPRSIPSSQIVQSLCVHLYKKSDATRRILALLYHVYNLSLNGSFYQPHVMLLTSHLPETIRQADISSQIAYNRALAQLGLAAFRQGMFPEARSCLQDLCGSHNARDLLAQNIALFSNEKDFTKMSNQTPFHMHINLELLECVYVVSSMLLDIPATAKAGPTESKKKIISRLFRRYLNSRDGEVFLGPPEDARDHICWAARHLAQGDWKTCYSFISRIQVWELFGSDEAEGIKAMLGRKIREEGLRTFLFGYSPFYRTLSLSSLSDMFDLTKDDVKKLVIAIISHNELHAQLDHSDENLIFPEIETTKLRSVASSFAERAARLVALNQKALDHMLDSEIVQRPSSASEVQATDVISGGETRGTRRNQHNSALNRRHIAIGKQSGKSPSVGMQPK